MLSITYMQPASRAIGLLATVLILASAFVYLAATNETGLVINGVVRFDTSGATIFYAAMAAAMICITPAGIVMLRNALNSTGALTFAEESITLPIGFWRQEWRALAYADISRAEIEAAPKNMFVAVIDTNMGVCRLASGSFASLDEFAFFVDELRARSEGCAG